jgi:hypothetical protein
MQIDSFKKVTFLYDTGPLPPPFCYKYQIAISSLDLESYEISIDLNYYDRDELSEDEIYDEGFTSDDNFQWKGHLPPTWVQEIINKLNSSNWKKQISAKPGETGLMVKVESEQNAEDLEPADLRSWEVFIQEIIQACFELSEREAPLYIIFMQINSDIDSRQLEITYSFAQRTVSLMTAEEKNKTIGWPDGRKLLKYIYGIDYMPEEGSEKTPVGKGSYISPGDGLWYQLDAYKKKGDEKSKIEKLNQLLLEYLD